MFTFKEDSSKDGGSRVLRNVGNSVSGYTVSYSRIRQSAGLPLREPHI